MTIPTRAAISSRSEFHDALRCAFAEAAHAGAAEIWLCDANFSDWPLSERSVIDNLTHWVHSRRRLIIYAQSFDEIARRHGRWTEWRRQWSHVVHCRSNDDLEAAEFPTICWVPGVLSVRLLDPIHCRGLVSAEAGDALVCREAIDAVSQRSAEAFPVTTLGL